jgi:hypothetical protein
MSNTFSFCVLENGKLPPGMKVTLANVIPSYAGKWLNLTLAERKEKRTISQNDYYWVAIVPHVRKVRFDSGDALSIDQVHEDLLAQFAPSKIATRFDGERYSRPMRSKEMSVKEMADYITAITACMAEFGEPVPVKEHA